MPSAPKLATPFTAAMELLLIFKDKAFVVAVLKGLLRSDVLSILSKPKLVLKPETVVAPVPPFAMATIPVTLVALPTIFP